MITSLYIPFTDFTINDKDGQRLLYENLVRSGPAYRLIVHESPSWIEIKSQIFWDRALEIIPSQRAEEYKEIVRRFFSPVTEATPYYTVSGTKYPTANLTSDLRRALSYILIAHDYKARIYEDDILEHSTLSNQLIRNQKVFSEEAISRVKFVESLIAGYQRDSISALSVNNDPRIFKDVMDLLSKEKVKALSDMNHRFGVLNVRKDLLKREIQTLLTQIIKDEWFPYVAQVVGLALSYYVDSGFMARSLNLLSGIAAKALSKYDFREYAPPIQSPNLFRLLNSKGISFFSYKPFNSDFNFFLPPRP